MEKRYRKIRRWGNQNVVPLNSIDCKDLNLKEGDEVDISKLKKRLKENE